MAEVTPDPIMRIAMGFMAAKHLFIASEIGVFEELAGAPATLDELAAKCGIPRRTLRISADAMVSLGLLERERDRYRNVACRERRRHSRRKRFDAGREDLLLLRGEAIDALIGSPSS